MTRGVRRARIGTAQPAFYAHTGDRRGDLLALLHAPYTAWHLSYVVYGAALASELDLTRLAGTLVAFFLGTGVAAHALDEWHSRPLATRLPGSLLVMLGAGGLAASVAVATVGAFVISPWTLAWAAAGICLAAGYTLEWHRLLHTDLSFALAWGGFPVVVGYWVQTERVNVAALLVALAATLLALAQRALSTAARDVRRDARDASAMIERPAGPERWPRDRLLATWERPLGLLAGATVTLAAGLVVMRL